MACSVCKQLTFENGSLCGLKDISFTSTLNSSILITRFWKDFPGSATARDVTVISVMHFHLTSPESI